LSLNADIDTLLTLAWGNLLTAAPYATMGTSIWIVIAYYFHQNMIDAMTGARAVSRQDSPRLYNLLENLCISRGITMPALKIADTDALNAFAAGMNQKQYSITVTRGLLDRLDDAEIEAVLGHELTHIRNGDVRMMVIAVIIAGVVSFFVELVFRLWFYNGFTFRGRSNDDERRGGGGAGLAILIAVGLIAIAYVLSFLIRLALSRSREYLADAGSVELTKNPDAMILALRKIEGRGVLPGATSAVMEMCVDNPRQGFGELFDTHPSVESRVEALVRYAGGHDPGPIVLPPAADDTEQIEPSSDDAQPGPWDSQIRDNQTRDNPTAESPPAGPWSTTPATPPAARPPDPAGAGPAAGPIAGPNSGPISGPWGPRTGA
jgi:heat shock protein HtpX